VVVRHSPKPAPFFFVVIVSASSLLLAVSGGTADTIDPTSSHVRIIAVARVGRRWTTPPRRAFAATIADPADGIIIDNIDDHGG
jgi:hypothetical protein